MPAKTDIFNIFYKKDVQEIIQCWENNNSPLSFRQISTKMRDRKIDRADSQINRRLQELVKLGILEKKKTKINTRQKEKYNPSNIFVSEIYKQLYVWLISSYNHKNMIQASNQRTIIFGMDREPLVIQNRMNNFYYNFNISTGDIFNVPNNDPEYDRNKEWVDKLIENKYSNLTKEDLLDKIKELLPYKKAYTNLHNSRFTAFEIGEKIIDNLEDKRKEIRKKMLSDQYDKLLIERKNLSNDIIEFLNKYADYNIEKLADKYWRYESIKKNFFTIVNEGRLPAEIIEKGPTTTTSDHLTDDEMFIVFDFLFEVEESINFDFYNTITFLATQYNTFIEKEHGKYLESHKFSIPY